MGSVPVVVADVFIKDSPEVATTVDDDPVEALVTDGTNESFGEKRKSPADLSRPLGEVAMVTVDVEERASEYGFALEPVVRDGIEMWAWRRSPDDRLPCFVTKRAALEWMEGRFRRAVLFDRSR